MATTAQQTQVEKPVSRPNLRWFFVGMALVFIATSIAGFLPAIINPGTRRAPLTLLAAVHGIVIFLWLFLYLAQALLIANRRVDLHRRVGLAGVLTMALVIYFGFTSMTATIRRGFDLSGDQHMDPHPDGLTTVDAPTAMIFNFSALLTFGIFAVTAIFYRRRPDLHKRLMLFANISLMVAPIAHFLGHLPPTWISPLMSGITYLLLYLLFLLAPMAYDFLVTKRILRLTSSLAVALFVSQLLQAFVVGPSASWHRFADWFSQ
jgi:FtsH-binding integral membrane protein